jgi:hypothetical protein
VIKCLNYKEHKSGCLDGFCDIFVEKWCLEIKGCKIFTKGAQSWFSLPSQTYTDESGETKYSPLLFITDKEISKQFCEAAFKAVNDFRAANPAEAPNVQPERVTPAEDSGGLPF